VLQENSSRRDEGGATNSGCGGDTGGDTVETTARDTEAVSDKHKDRDEDKEKDTDRGKDEFGVSCMEDGMVDVVVVFGAFHLGQLSMGTDRPHRICQAGGGAHRVARFICICVLDEHCTERSKLKCEWVMRVGTLPLRPGRCGWCSTKSSPCKSTASHGGGPAIFHTLRALRRDLVCNPANEPLHRCG
jgi:hypothetical protein